MRRNRAPQPARVGVLHSLTGSVALSELPVVDATLLAIEEINASGGLLGRTLEPVIADGCSQGPAFAEAAESLFTGDGVCAVFGCYTSASRRSVIPVIEAHDAILLYPTFYEGIESSEHVVYGGSTANQCVIPAVSWFLDNRGRDFYLIGSDYVYPRSVNAVVKDLLAALGGHVAGEVYVPLGQSDVAPLVRAIADAKPGVILSTLVGDTNMPFFRELRAAGIRPASTPTLSFVIGECELQHLDRAQMAGDYLAFNYFQSIDTPQNARFVESFRARYGQERVVGDTMAAAYNLVHLWAQAVRACGSTRPADVRRAIRGQRRAGAEGTLYVDEENLHLWRKARIGRIRADGQVDVVWTSENLIRPMPYSPYRTRREWHEMLAELHAGWGASWSSPVPPDTPRAPSWVAPPKPNRASCRRSHTASRARA
ncbi:urea ABC transporter substrate-binding protein [Kitasatospora sp. NBC_01302]|uniref:urea ABC transporter substrate-binding protein n=1 Tax=Kitasatospora sp. NBC_01302 TaxID=2903575 RepID=UPI002E136A4E|nr:urea ABC transporter substrate-binding protein [Kitasatospora sp. NBC_01302]